MDSINSLPWIAQFFVAVVSVCFVGMVPYAFRREANLKDKFLPLTGFLPTPSYPYKCLAASDRFFRNSDIMAGNKRIAEYSRLCVNTGGTASNSRAAHYKCLVHQVHCIEDKHLTTLEQKA